MASIKTLLNHREDPNVTHVSYEESARVAAKNPGQGTPLSMLSPENQQRLRDGKPVSAEEIDKDRYETTRRYTHGGQA